VGGGQLEMSMPCCLLRASQQARRVRSDSAGAGAAAAASGALQKDLCSGGRPREKCNRPRRAHKVREENTKGE
jgi:hypothetical protein